MSDDDEKPAELQYESATDPAFAEPDRRWTIRMAVLTAGPGPLVIALILLLGGFGGPYATLSAFILGGYIMIGLSLVALIVGLTLKATGRGRRTKGIAAGLLLGLGLNIMIVPTCFGVAIAAG